MLKSEEGLVSIIGKQNEIKAELFVLICALKDKKTFSINELLDIVLDAYAIDTGDCCEVIDDE